ncbi:MULTISPECIES: PP2C family serine/threonine-protein phosphatase [Enterobacteriaceae]|uniref:Protein phosphatase 2C domain-containing protein n=1 Tax=Klebsiella pneumoniae TaxID=573 RepID=A0A6B2F031_KLEPN|nr:MULTISPECIES: PP2C family serine/threonine-protein phosphatase [Enterobacteriaceae]HCH7903708.1 protein phosphatase 2C domain-containing protein [Klebsiella oxytoca]HCI9672475.1 protein phosphatase 2C domain-containing protein [Klebsiella variicola]EMH91353.1 phosphatase 2C family protein [Klebsiella pneumoniae JHCK1]MBM2758148.1 protein phosphatase 2C domain-containing protein [Klebsiella pneumoniae]MBU4647041.1 protein phosphatase 2C domain-containing protein [Klebsiella pneumoniae]
MSEFITPEHKIIALILEASGEPTDADKVCCLGNIPDVALAVRQLRETVIQHCASEAIPAENTQTVSERLTQPFSDNILPPQNSGESEADRPEIEPVHAATALQGNDKQEAHSEMVDDTASEGVQGHTEEVPDATGVLQTEASVTAQPEDMDKTSPVVSDNLSADSAVSALRPGEVPQRVENKTSPAPGKVPEVFIMLPNARAGEPYDVRLEIATDTGVEAEITEVNFSQDIGLIFDINERRLQGTPGQSGDFELTVKWSCSSHRDNEKKLLFVVNPDPKSLWKVIDPPSDAPFYKKSIDHQSVCRSGIHIAGASRRGRSHEHVGSFRDDDYYLNFSDVSGWSVLLVADGAGSAKYSREGSRIVSETVGNYLFNQFKTEKGLEIKNRVLRWNSEDQRAVWEFMNHHFRQAAVLAVNNISSAAILAEDKVKSFSTTLLATVTFRDGADLFAASFWLGDGAIAAYGPAGKVRVLGTPDSGEYAGQTRFLDADAVSDAGFSKRISIGKWNDISHLVLMTDGVSDPWFETDNGLQNPQKWDRLMAELSPLLTDPEHASAQLVEWLNFFSPGNHDDRTIIVLW